MHYLSLKFVHESLVRDGTSKSNAAYICRLCGDARNVADQHNDTRRSGPHGSRESCTDRWHTLEYADRVVIAHRQYKPGMRSAQGRVHSHPRPSHATRRVAEFESECWQVRSGPHGVAVSMSLARSHRPDRRIATTARPPLGRAAGQVVRERIFRRET